MVNKLTILAPFLTHLREQLHLAEISRETSVPHPTARLWLAQLEREGLLTRTTKGRLTLYALTDHPNRIDYLTAAEKIALIAACERHLALAELAALLHRQRPRIAVLFGSAARSFEEAGDLDLLTTGQLDENEIRRFENLTGKDVHIIKVTGLAKVDEALRKEIMTKHLIIRGSEEVVSWLAG